MSDKKIKEVVETINYLLEDNTDYPVSVHELAWQLVELTRPEESEINDNT
tara:strand:- start:1876 stop:2025 length:150 start_codon:yes stop_codon:yes gene_type:complete